MAPKIGHYCILQSLYGQGGQNRDIGTCMGFSLYLKACSLVTFHPNVLKFGKTDNSDMLFREMDQFFVTN